MAKVLIIDDVLGVRRSIAGVLSRAGHEIEEAADGLAGIEVARRCRPDIAVVDMLMPEQDGLETLEQLRAGGLAGKLIAISGGGALIDAEDALSASQNLADATIRKPFENNELISLVNSLGEE
ncbi:MAG: response regulator [Oceanicaulis sp.]|jgi:CheY-like chemotaxis protein|nr:response regulator [Oceanicaulis sp.]